MLGLVSLEINTPNFEHTPIFIQTFLNVDQFDRSPTGDPRQHLKQFMEVCQLFQQNGVLEGIVKLKLFTFSLRDRAKSWLNYLPLGSVSSWEDLCRSFYFVFNHQNSLSS